MPAPTAAAVVNRPLPDDHAAAALWWRISRQLTPAVAAAADSDLTLTTGWSPRLIGIVGADQAGALQASRWWPPLVTAIDHALQRGWRLDDLLDPSEHPRPVDRPSPSPGLAHFGAHQPGASRRLRRACLRSPATRPLGWPDRAFRHRCGSRPGPTGSGTVPSGVDQATGAADQDWVEPDLAVAALVRTVAGPRADRRGRRPHVHPGAGLAGVPVSRNRMVEINRLALAYFQDQFPGSWGQAYLSPIPPRPHRRRAVPTRPGARRLDRPGQPPARHRSPTRR